jgi:hypothetical protein
MSHVVQSSPLLARAGAIWCLWASERKSALSASASPLRRSDSRRVTIPAACCAFSFDKSFNAARQLAAQGVKVDGYGVAVGVIGAGHILWRIQRGDFAQRARDHGQCAGAAVRFRVVRGTEHIEDAFHRVHFAFRDTLDAQSERRARVRRGARWRRRQARSSRRRRRGGVANSPLSHAWKKVLREIPSIAAISPAGVDVVS